MRPREERWGWPRALSLKSMRGRMALLLGLAMLPAGAIAMQVGLNAVSAREAADREALSRAALEAVVAERAEIDETREVLRVLASAPPLQDIAAGDCQRWLGEVVERYDQLAAIGVSDIDGALLCSIPARPPGFRPVASTLRMRAAARGAFTMGYIGVGRLTGVEVVGAMEPIRDQRGRLVGMISASIPVEHLRKLLLQPIKLPNEDGLELAGARGAIVDFTGATIASVNLGADVPEVGLPSPAQIRNRLGQQPAFLDVSGGRAIVLPLHAPDLYAVIAWPDPPYWRSWLGVTVSIAAPLLIWMLAIAAGWFAIEVFVARPLSSLESAARSFARGEDVRDPPSLRSAPEEIRSLRRTVSAMAKTLRGREERLVHALAEERALLKEIHHRVKNNLQMVASLLNIQARAAADEDEAWGLARAHDRVQLLALVHQRIYASGELRMLRLDELAGEIARTLLQSRGEPAKQIDLVLDLGPAEAEADRAVPLAFLLGEGVSSALDSLSGEGPAELRLMLQQDADGETRIAVDSDLDSERAGNPGPGARLVDAFARQLGAVAGRDTERPYMLWVCVPPAAAVAS